MSVIWTGRQEKEKGWQGVMTESENALLWKGSRSKIQKRQTHGPYLIAEKSGDWQTPQEEHFDSPTTNIDTGEIPAADTRLRVE